MILGAGSLTKTCDIHVNIGWHTTVLLRVGNNDAHTEAVVQNRSSIFNVDQSCFFESKYPRADNECTRNLSKLNSVVISVQSVMPLSTL